MKITPFLAVFTRKVRNDSFDLKKILKKTSVSVMNLTLFFLSACFYCMWGLFEVLLNK